MPEEAEGKTISISPKALDILTKAKKQEESFSEVILRLSETKVTALRQRGESEIITSDGRKLLVQVIQSKCMGAESCVVVAPTVFSLDVKKLSAFRRDNEPLGIKDVVERSVDMETVVLAAKSCPYKAIYVKDTATQEELAGEPW